MYLCDHDGPCKERPRSLYVRMRAAVYLQSLPCKRQHGTTQLANRETRRATLACVRALPLLKSARRITYHKMR